MPDYNLLKISSPSSPLKKIKDYFKNSKKLNIFQSAEIQYDVGILNKQSENNNIQKLPLNN